MMGVDGDGGRECFEGFKFRFERGLFPSTCAYDRQNNKSGGMFRTTMRKLILFETVKRLFPIGVLNRRMYDLNDNQ